MSLLLFMITYDALNSYFVFPPLPRVEDLRPTYEFFLSCRCTIISLKYVASFPLSFNS